MTGHGTGHDQWSQDLRAPLIKKFTIENKALKYNADFINLNI